MGVNKRLIGAGATDTGGGGGAITADSHFKGVTYQGTGSTRTVGGLNFQPDFVWIKNYGDGEADRDHKLFDSTRGIKEALQTNVDNGQDFSNSHLLDFLPTGFEVGNDNDINGTFPADQFVAWCWHADSGNTSSNSNGTITSTVQANDVAGFSIVKYTGNGSSGASIGHGLSVQPNMIISKNMDSSEDWMVFHSSLSANNALKINSTNAAFDATAGTKGGGFSVDDTKMTVLSGASNQDNNNKSGDEHIAYCFRDITGYQKFGSYTGDSGTSHSIETGFKPAFILIRRIDSGDNWLIFDSFRNGTTNNNQILKPNAKTQQTNPNLGNGLDFTDTGFTIKTTDSSVNHSSGTYIYWAIAGTYPSETPTIEESFSAENWGGSDYRKNIMNNFRAGLVITRAKGESHHWGWYDAVTGLRKWLITNNNGAENEGDYGPSSYNTNNTEFYGNHTPANSDYLNETYNGWFIKAGESTSSNSNGSITSTVSANAAAGFSIVRYSGTGSSATVGHGLSAAPEIVIVKRTDSTGNWSFNGSVGGLTYGSNKLLFNSSNGANSDTNEVTAASSTTFTVSTSSSVNQNGGSYTAYCFHSVSGFSKFGSYSGSGSLQTITTGFTPDYVVIKKTNANGEDWAVFSSYDLGMSLNSFNQTQSQQAFNNSTMFSQSTGFQVPSSSGMTNGSGQSYFYWAMKKNVTQDDTTQYNFNVIAYTGNASANHYIDGFNFRPDLVVTKVRNATGQWSWFDSVRGAGNRLDSSTNSAATQLNATLESFKFDGFTFGNEAGNNSGENYISYGWRAGRTWLVNNDGSTTSLSNANKSAGFSIVKWVGDDTATTVGHGLSSSPEFIIIKRTDATRNWLILQTINNEGGYLDLTDSFTSQRFTDWFNSSSPSSTTIPLGAYNYVNGSNMIMYCFHSVSGKRKFGSYTGNGSANHSITGLGFQPDFVLLKNTDSSTTYWSIFDSVRGGALGIFPNDTQAESNETGVFVSLDSDGFTVNANNTANQNGSTIFYWAEKIH